MKDSPRSAPLARTVRGPTAADTPAHVCHARVRVKIHSVSASAGPRASRKHFCPSLLALYLNAPHSNKIARQRDQRKWVRAGGQEGNSKPCQRNLPPGCPSSSRWRTACPLAKELDDGGVVAKQQDVMSLEVRLSGQQTAVNSPQFLEVDVQREQVRVQESGFVGARAPEGYGDLHPRVMV